MNYKIVIDDKIQGGKPIIKGTRLPVEIVLGSLAGGMSYKEIEKEYDITKEDILACIDYAREIISEEQVAVI